MLEVYADVICPFAHVSLRRLAARRTTVRREDVRFLVRAWPLEVVNGEPFDPAAIDEEIDVLRGSVAPDLFAGFDPAAYPSTSLPALALTAAGYELGPDVGESIAFELRDLLFEQGVDVADPDVLGGLADRHGLDRRATQDRSRVDAELEEGRRRGVIGSPHYFVDDQDVFCPVLDITKPAGSMRVDFDTERFEQLAQQAFPAG